MLKGSTRKMVIGELLIAVTLWFNSHYAGVLFFSHNLFKKSSLYKKSECAYEMFDMGRPFCPSNSSPCKETVKDCYAVFVFSFLSFSLFSFFENQYFFSLFFSTTDSPSFGLILKYPFAPQILLLVKKQLRIALVFLSFPSFLFFYTTSQFPIFHPSQSISHFSAASHTRRENEKEKKWQSG
jgi:hypothetical protein